MTMTIKSDDSAPVGLWNDLPETILSEIYIYLNLKDRVSASSVCKNWFQAFQAPSLWQSVVVTLHDNPRRKVFSNDELRSNVDLNQCGNGVHISITESETEEEMDVSEAEEMDVSDAEETLEQNSEDNLGYSEGSTTDNESLDVKVNLEYDFVSSTLNFNDEAATKYAEKYGHHLKDLQFECEPMDKKLNEEFANRIASFFNCLIKKNCQLQELCVFLYNTANKWDKESKQNVVNSIHNFLVTQVQLETLVFGNPLYGDEIKLLKAAASKSGSTLKILHCMFFDDESKESQATFCSSLDQLSQLHTAGFLLQSLTANEVKIINNKKDLKRLTLYDLGSNRDINWEIESYDLSIWPLPEWRKGLKLHPDIEDGLGGEYWTRCSHHPLLKLPLKPITHLNVQFRCEDSAGINAVLNYILKNYSDALVSLNVADSIGFGREDQMIREIVQSCNDLRELIANTFLSTELVEFICEKQEKNEIDLMNFYFKVGSSETRDAINDIMKRHGNLMSTRNWEYDMSISMEELVGQETN